MQVRQRDREASRGHKPRRVLSLIFSAVTTLLIILTGLAGLVTSASATTAQGESVAQAGSIEGEVVDPTGQGVPGVTLTFRQEEGDFQQDVITDEVGRFRVDVPEIGRYFLTIDPELAPEGTRIPREYLEDGKVLRVREGEPTTTTIQLTQQEGVRGTLVNAAREPVPGVTIEVSNEDGSFTESIVTDAEGNWVVVVPETGQYTATLLEDTLPEGVEPREGASMELEVMVRPRVQRTVAFQLGEREGTFGDTGQLLQLTAEGVRFGLLIALAALGLSMVFGTTGLVNFAHGELVALGAVLAYIINNWGVHILLASLVALVVATLFAGAQDIALWRPLRRRKTGLIAMMIVTIGLALFLRFMYQYFIGPSSLQYQQYVGQRGLEIGLIRLTPIDLASMGIALTLLLAVSFLLIYTKMGKAMRAVSDNPALAAASGIDVQRVILMVWLIGGFLAALSGVLFGYAEGIKFDMGMNMLLLVFAGVILGGLGTAFGALVGSLVVGLFIMVSTLWIPPELKNVGALLILIVILLFRPQGILGRRERIG